MRKCFWSVGERAKIARMAGMKPHHLCEVLYRRRTVSKDRAKLLEAASTKLGCTVPFEDWLFNVSTRHPAFFGKPNLK